MLIKTHSLALLGLLSITLAGACNTPVEETEEPGDQIGSSTEDIEAAEFGLGSAGCGQVLACYNRCANNGDVDQCYTDCYNGGTAGAQVAANNLNQCMINNGCRDINCAACSTQKNACIPAAQPAVAKKWHCYARAFLGTCQNQCRPGELEPVFGIGVAQSRNFAIYWAGNMCFNNLQGRMTVSGKPLYGDPEKACEVYSCVEKPVN